MIRRQTTPTIKMILDIDENLGTWDVIFTMRSGDKRSAPLLFEFDNTDDRMTVSNNTVTVVLSDEDTESIPEGVQKVYVQLNLKKAGMHFATNIIAISTADNLMEGEEDADS